jgi:hypothetical protein
MKKPTMQEVLKLVTFGRGSGGDLFVRQVHGDIKESVEGSIGGSVQGFIHGDIGESVLGNVKGTISGRVMEEPTMKEVLELVRFYRDKTGLLHISNVKSDVKGCVYGNVLGAVWGNVGGDISGDVGGSIAGSVGVSIGGTVKDTISGRKWQYVETTIEKAIRLIRERRYEEAIMALEEDE